MMNLWPEILLVLLAYLLGSIPFGYLFTKKLTGKNILDLGSGNIGSTNVGRIAGKKVAVLTQVCDMSKGLLPVLLVYFLNTGNIFPFEKYFICLVALSTIIGHDFSIFLKLKGGKGVNTTLGASLLLAPYSVAVSVLFYFIIKWKFKFVSLASICLAFFLTITDLVIHEISFLTLYLCLCSGLILIQHRGNMMRLVVGTELRSE
jgi:glycerol-3-phosphate acyltransferase PlsY